MSYKDVREWIQKVNDMGELKIVENAGALSVLSSKHKENTPALLFDHIKGYPAGYRILVGFFESLRRSALTTKESIWFTSIRARLGRQGLVSGDVDYLYGKLSLRSER